jgi:hypothetical protein
MRFKSKDNKLNPSFAIPLKLDAITLKGRNWATGCTISGNELIGKKTPERISCGNVNDVTSGLIAS